jgi:hypothetical protein
LAPSLWASSLTALAGEQERGSGLAFGEPKPSYPSGPGREWEVRDTTLPVAGYHLWPSPWGGRGSRNPPDL